MGGKRRAPGRQAAEQPDQDGGGNQEAAGPSDSRASGTDGGRKRQAMADVARRRAAHFANFDAGVEEADANNPHVGGTEARNLGPWSSAVELANARDAALAKRQEKLAEGGGRRASAGGWEPRRNPALGPRPAQAVPPLAQLALDLVVAHLEDVESLEGLPEAVKLRIADAACAVRALSPAAARLFAEGRPTEVRLADCTQLDAAALGALLLDCASHRLERLELGLAGRGLTDAAAAAFAAACGGLPALRALCLPGAYRLSDAGLLALLRAAPGLQELGLAQCSRLEGAALRGLPTLVPGLRELDLADCRGLGKEDICAATGGLARLTAVVLDGIAEVDDALLSALCSSAPGLERLSLCRCGSVGDAGLAALAAALPGLQALQLDDCPKVSSEGLRALAAGCRGLTRLSLRRCVRVDDAGIEALAALGTLRAVVLNSLPQVSGAALRALGAGCRDRLESLDVSWCQGVDDEALGALCDACPGLATLELWGCSQVTNRFLHGHANDGLRTLGREATTQAA